MGSSSAGDPVPDLASRAEALLCAHVDAGANALIEAIREMADRAQRTVRDQLREFANISRRDSSAGAPPEPTGPAASRALPPAPLSDRSGADSADESHSTADASSTARDPMGTQDPSHPAAVASLLRVLGPDVEWGALPAALAWDPNAWAPRLVQQSEYSRLSTRARLCDRLERRVATLETHLARAKANLKRSNALAPTDLPPHIAAALAPTDPATPPHSTAHPSPTPSAAPRPDPHHEACGVRLWVSAPAGRGWVEQRSPACAAAAVAGAWNAVRPPSSPLFPGGLPRIQQDDVLDLYREYWADEVRAAARGILSILQPFSPAPDSPSPSQPPSSSHPATTTTPPLPPPSVLAGLESALRERGVIRAGHKPGKREVAAALAVYAEVPEAEWGVEDDQRAATGDADGEGEQASQRGGRGRRGRGRGRGGVRRRVKGGTFDVPVAIFEGPGRAGDGAGDAEGVADGDGGTAEASACGSERGGESDASAAPRRDPSDYGASPRPRARRSASTGLLGTHAGAVTGLSLPAIRGARRPPLPAVVGIGLAPPRPPCDPPDTDAALSPPHVLSTATAVELDAPPPDSPPHPRDALGEERVRAAMRALLRGGGAHRGEAVARVRAWASRQGALGKLSGPRPSTAPVGTDRVMWALQRLASRHQVQLSVWRLMGAGRGRYEVPLAAEDGEDMVAEQWGKLLSWLSAPRAALIYHLENHFSLIYAAREWRSDAGYGGARTVRQVLVARPGQRPCYWVDFAWLRDTCLAWKGYNVVAVACPGPAGGPQAGTG